ncbi:MAG: 3-deoxy-D-manno-octulosonic acid transferase [Proteobacteria bacterium]|nr:MAG: 3-deoxy-D-manno-octulosonic acid transferase [Pseudomonadota bacterium]
MQASPSHQQPHKWRQHFLFDSTEPKPNCIWLHACSMGEVTSIIPLLEQLHTLGHSLHLTVITRTGMQHAQRQLGNIASISYLPWDLPGFMQRFVNTLKPALLLLAETEFWPGMFKACKKNNIPIIGINTRISDRSFPKYHASRYFWKRWLAPVNLFLPQSPLDAERLIAMGVQPKKIHIAGNLKYAVQAPDVDCNSLRKKLDTSLKRPILLLASTHHDEEKRLLSMLPEWLHVQPDLLTIIVPRHPERFNHVAELISNQGLQYSRWSDAQINQNSQVILIDGMGILQSLYTVTDITIVAGSLVDIGGHNPIEAAVCGRGVVTGPYIQNFRDIMNDMQTAGAAIVNNTDEELKAAIIRLLQQPHELRQLNAQAALFMQDKSQVLPEIIHAIKPFLPNTCV